MALQMIHPNVNRQHQRKPGPARAGLFELNRPYVAGLYSLDVIVEFNSTAYNNESLFF